MDIVDNVDDAQPTEEEVIPENSIVGKPYDAEIFDAEWRNAYVHVTESLRRVYEQLGEGIRVEMESQLPDFDPATNDDHKELFENSVTKKVSEIGAQAHFMGLLKGVMVVYHNVAKRYGFDTTDIVATLNSLTPENSDVNANVEKLKEEQNDGSKIHEPVREEETRA